jgi:DNA-binding transcriptional MerR regulator
MFNKNIIIQGKTHFKLNEVCSMTGVKPYVLRFWENEFTEIKPSLSPSGEKLYSQKDLDIISLIKKLLFRDKFTIEKAKYELSLHPFMQDKSSEGLIDISAEEQLDHSVSADIEGDVNVPYYDLVREKLKTIILKSESIEKSHHWFQV